MVNADRTRQVLAGAIMSILNVSSIEKAVDKNVTTPADVFNQNRKPIIDRLKNDSNKPGIKDGLDGSLISFNSNKTKMSCYSSKPYLDH